MGHGDYPLNEFAIRLAEVESRFAKELHAVIECFVQSRVDLPVKHLEDISKTHARRAKNLKKSVDEKKSDGVNLWKITNVYSACCVDQDEAMREIRSSLKKHIRKESMKIRLNGEDVSSYRRVADDYRPLISQRGNGDKKTEDRRSIATIDDHSTRTNSVQSQDIYDTETASASPEEKQRWLEAWKVQVEKEEKEREETRRKIEKRQSMKIFGSKIDLGKVNLGNLNLGLGKFFEKRAAANGTQNNGLKAETKTMQEDQSKHAPTIEPAPHLLHSRVIVPGLEEAKLVMKF